ncbi:MAG: hypothetical protein QME54_00480 [Actinomycetota bacterium]|nr:hypothetical protein [Actinomycetota bacterium]
MKPSKLLGIKSLCIAFLLLFGSVILFLNPFNARGLTSSNANAAIYTGNDGWLTPANARSFVKVGGRIHWVFVKLHEGKKRIVYSSSTEGKIWSSGACIAPLISESNRYQVQPCICSQSDGTLNVFYQEEGYIYWIYSKDNGETWSSPCKVSRYWHPYGYTPHPGWLSFSPCACVDRYDNIHLICCQDPRIGIVYYFYDYYQETWTSGELVFFGWDTGGCRFPSIIVDDQDQIHVLYGMGVWFYWDTPSYLYQKRENGIWKDIEYLFARDTQPTILVDEDDTPLVSVGEFANSRRVPVQGTSAVFIRDNPTASDHIDRWSIYPVSTNSGGQLTLGSYGEFIFPAVQGWGENQYEIFQNISYNKGETWRINFQTDDYDPSIGFNRNFNPRTAWSKYNFPKELATAFFFEKQTPSNLDEGPYQLWFYPGEGGQDIITDVKVQPQEFDPYEETGEISIYYHLERKSKVTMEIFDSGGRLVKTLMDGGVREGGDHIEKWYGIINCEEITVLERDKGVLIAPDGIYTIKITACNANDPSLSDTKEVKVKVKSDW